MRNTFRKLGYSLAFAATLASAPFSYSAKYDYDNEPSDSIELEGENEKPRTFAENLSLVYNNLPSIRKDAESPKTYLKALAKIKRGYELLEPLIDSQKRDNYSNVSKKRLEECLGELNFLEKGCKAGIKTYNSINRLK